MNETLRKQSDLCPRTRCLYSPGSRMAGVRCTYHWTGAMPCTGRLVCMTCGREKPTEVSYG